MPTTAPKSCRGLLAAHARRARSRIFQQIARARDPEGRSFRSTPILSFNSSCTAPMKSASTASSTARPISTSSAGCMEEEGIFYFFKHANGEHTMVLTDHGLDYPDVPGQ